MIFRTANWADVMEMLLWNITVGTVFHVALLVVCLKRSTKAYDPGRRRYQAKNWERGGKVYKEAFGKSICGRKRFPSLSPKTDFPKNIWSKIQRWLMWMNLLWKPVGGSGIIPPVSGW